MIIDVENPNKIKSWNYGEIYEGADQDFIEYIAKKRVQEKLQREAEKRKKVLDRFLLVKSRRPKAKEKVYGLGYKRNV